MVGSKAFASAALMGLAGAVSLPRAVPVPSANGFPNPNADEQKTIAQQAGGLLPNAPPATALPDNTTTAFQLIAFNELFETAFFSSLISNITNNATGYTDAPAGTLEALKAVLAQEEQHALGAISTLKAANRFAPTGCEYQFGVTNLTDAISLAETFTAVVLGTLQDANVVFSNDGVSDYVRLVSSVIGQEGEQNGFYRLLLNRRPSESPFLTTVPAPFAYSALQLFVSSCPFPLSDIDLPIFPGLMTNGSAVTLLQPGDQTLSFSADLTNSTAAKPYVGGNGTGLYVTYVTGQQLPFSVNLTDVAWNGSMISFNANFPYSEYVMDGFSHGSLTTGNNFSNADAIVNQTLAAPAVIQVNNTLNAS